MRLHDSCSLARLRVYMDGTKLASTTPAMPPPAQMRLRITRQIYDSIDGIQFSAFRPGYVYEVGSTVGNYLLADGAAEPVDDDEPSIVLPPEKQLFHPAALLADTNAVTPRKKFICFDEPIAEAADRPPRRKRVLRRLRLFVRRTLDARVAALAAEVERIGRDFHDFELAG